MKAKWVHLKSIIKYGDMAKLAHQANVSSAVLTNIVNGKTNIENYPQLPAILGEYVKRRTIELKGEVELFESTKQACEQLGITPLSEEMELKKKLTRFRVFQMFDHGNVGKLLEVNEKLGLRLKTQHNEDWSNSDWEDFALAICDKLGLKKRRN